MFHILLYLLCCMRFIEPFTLQRVILATDENPTYIQFWPVTSLMWKKILDVQPTLALIAHNLKLLEEGEGDVIRFDPLPGIPTHFQAQVIRLLLPTLFPEDMCIISDIDMIPLQKKYFHDAVQPFSSNNFVVYRDKAYGPEATQYPMCYLAAQGKVFADIFKVYSKEDIIRTIKEWYALGHGWMSDEIILYKKLHEWPLRHKQLKLLGAGVGPRVDRMDWQYDVKKLKNNEYIDSHMLRPYKDHKAKIDKLVKDRLS